MTRNSSSFSRDVRERRAERNARGWTDLGGARNSGSGHRYRENGSKNGGLP